jgi:chromosome transmission fidelity protein 8
MSEIPIYPQSRALAAQPQSHPNPLPELLQTPGGLALLEMQGTINLPAHKEQKSDFQNPNGGNASSDDSAQDIPIGRLMFPDYHPDTQAPGSTAWMKRVYLYVGKHQRLTGEVKKLPKAIAVIRRRRVEDVDEVAGEDRPEELEVVEIVKYKLLFSQRPEPVGTWNGEV